MENSRNKLFLKFKLNTTQCTWWNLMPSHSVPSKTWKRAARMECQRFHLRDNYPRLTNAIDVIRVKLTPQPLKSKEPVVHKMSTEKKRLSFHETHKHCGNCGSWWPCNIPLINLGQKQEALAHRGTGSGIWESRCKSYATSQHEEWWKRTSMVSAVTFCTVWLSSRIYHQSL